LSQNCLLDTSAFRSLGYKRIEQLRHEGHRLHASPYTFWELLCHVSEKDFERAKGQLIGKSKLVDFLDDPRAEIERAVLPAGAPIYQRVPDMDKIYAALAALENAESLADFYRSYIVDDRGQYFAIKGCSEQAQEALQHEEDIYRGFVKSVIACFSLKTETARNASERHQRVLELVKGYEIVLARKGAMGSDLNSEVRRRTYIYFSYVLHRALKLHEDGAKEAPRNDHEDARLCLHLQIDTPCTIVTCDTRLRAAIEETIKLLPELGVLQRGIGLQVCGFELNAANHPAKAANG